MYQRLATILLLMLGVCIAVDAQTDNTPNITVIAEGLINPIGLAQLPNGNLLIAEEGTGNNDLSAGISLMLPDGTIGRLVSNFPSSRDSGDLSGVPLVAVSPNGEMIYIGNFNAEHLWTLPVVAAETIPETPFTPEDLGAAMERLNNVYLINPFDVTFDAEGAAVVTDASGNGIAKETENGTTRFIHRFDTLADPENEQLQIQAVPTGVTRVDDEYYVALFGGCPYPANSGEIVAVDENRNQRTVIDNLNMPIDVALDTRGNLWVLEFATFTPDASCFDGTGYRSKTGRLSRFEDGVLTTVLENLDFPGAVLPLPDGSFYVTEVFAGRVLHIQFDDAADSATVPVTWHFANVAEEVGITFTHGAFATNVFWDPVAMMGAGLCWIDYNNDGWLDLYLVNSHSENEVSYWEDHGGLPQNALFRNDRGTFTDISASTQTNLSIRGNGCVAADFNNDGWDDIFVTAQGPDVFLVNNGDGTFSELAGVAGIDAPEWNSATAVTDLNRDGWLDLFVGSYIDPDKPGPNPIGAFPQDYQGLPNRLYVSNGIDESGQVTFTEVTRQVGVQNIGRTLGALFSDLDNDSDPDLYIANDGEPNRLYQYEPSDTFPGFYFGDTYSTSGVNDRGSGMGVSSGDWTGDGWFDLIVTNWDSELNAIYRNESQDKGHLSFAYSTYRIGMAGLGNNMTGWGVHYADFDHDTDLDLLTVNGRIPVSNFESDAEFVRLYGNRTVEGFPGEFREWTSIAGLEAVGTLMARGSAAADFDNDGDLDIAINSIGGPAVILRNVAPPGNWLTIDLGAVIPGARAEVLLADGVILHREALVGSSYLASEDPRLHFGLGKDNQIQQVKITFPDGEKRTYDDVPVNQVFVVD